MDYIRAINNAFDTSELSETVDIYLDKIGQLGLADGETWAETATRLGGDPVLELAEKRWFEVLR